MPEDSSRALFVALARQVATEVADLQARGWEVSPPTESVGFVFRKTFNLPFADDGIAVRVREVRGPNPRVRIQVSERELDLEGDQEALVALLEADGHDEISRIHRLVVERLN